MKYILSFVAIVLVNFDVALAVDLNQCRNLLSSVLKQPAGYYIVSQGKGEPASRLNISSDSLPVLSLANGWNGQQPQGLGQIAFDWQTLLKYAPLANFKASSQEGHPGTKVNQKFYNEVISCGISSDGAFSMEVKARATSTDFSSWPVFKELYRSSQVVRISKISNDTVLLQGQVDYVENGRSQHYQNAVQGTLKKVGKADFFY
ncbi:MAG: hypothetical protein JSU04_06080 [Bdellovibrionales bacterium]|nr:hypothetical protein [Bdellovibrionales bacterium]